MRTKHHELIADNQSLVSAQFQHGTPIQTYDDGWGPLFILRDSMGIVGIIRAMTWEDAWSIAEDEFFPAADDEANEEPKRISEMPDGPERRHASACWDEAYGCRNNSRKEADGSLSGIYSKDLNGESLDILTPAMVADLGIVLNIENNE